MSKAKEVGIRLRWGALGGIITVFADKGHYEWRGFFDSIWFFLILGIVFIIVAESWPTQEQEQESESKRVAVPDKISPRANPGGDGEWQDLWVAEAPDNQARDN